MHFGVHLSNRGPEVSRDDIRVLAQRADDLGYHSVWVSDHVVIPTQYTSVYPYGDLFTVAAMENYFEPLITMGYLAGCTERVLIGTSVLVLPYRPAVLSAKMIATIDAVSKGRVILGIGVGWFEEEFEALQSPPFAERGDVSDEQIHVFKKLWTEPESSFEGKHYRFATIRCAPKPTQRPHPPIWVGGHGKRALRRAAELGDGWHVVRMALEELSENIGRVRAQLQIAGRQDAPFTISYRCNLNVQDAEEPGRKEWDLFAPPAVISSDLRRLSALGVEHVVFDLQTRLPMVERLRTIERFAKEVMPQFPS